VEIKAKSLGEFHQKPASVAQANEERTSTQRWELCQQKALTSLAHGMDS